MKTLFTVLSLRKERHQVEVFEAATNNLYNYDYITKHPTKRD